MSRNLNSNSVETFTDVEKSLEADMYKLWNLFCYSIVIRGRDEPLTESAIGIYWYKWHSCQDKRNPCIYDWEYCHIFCSGRFLTLSVSSYEQLTMWSHNKCFWITQLHNQCNLKHPREVSNTPCDAICNPQLSPAYSYIAMYQKSSII